MPIWFKYTIGRSQYYCMPGEIEAMEVLQGTNLALYQYYLQCRTNNGRCARLMEKTAEMWEHAAEDEENKLRLLFDIARMLAYGLSAMAAAAEETKRKKKTLLSILDCTEAKLAIDINELSERKDATFYFGDQFTYKATISKNWLKISRLFLEMCTWKR